MGLVIWICCWEKCSFKIKKIEGTDLMLTMSTRLKELARQDKDIKVAIVGAGKWVRV